MIFNYLSVLDYLIFLVFILSLIYLSHRSKFAKSGESNENYFLMGRRLSLPMFIATLVSTWYGGIFGVTQITFENGVYSFFTQGFFWYLSYLIFALFMVPKLFKRRDVYTLPDLVHKIVGPRAAKLTAVFNVVDVIPVAYILSLGLFIQSISPLSLFPSMLIGALFVASYTAWGGFRSVVYTDCLQFIVMFLGVFFVLYFSITEMGPLTEMWSKLPTAHKEPTANESWVSFAVWGFIALATLIDPNFHQRCFAAKDIKTARLGIILSTIFWVIFDLCTTLGALYARAYMPDLNASSAYMDYSLQVLPLGFRGLLIISIAATIMSTMDSYLFTASNITAKNLFSSKEQFTIKIHRAFIYIFALLAVFAADQFTGSFKQIWKFFGSLNGGCLLIPIMLALQFKGKISDKPFVISVLSSAVISIIWEFKLKNIYISNIDTFYVAVITNIIMLVILLPIFKALRKQVN